MEYDFYEPKDRLKRFEGALREMEQKHFLARLNERNARIVGRGKEANEQSKLAGELEKAHSRTKAEYDILAEQIEREEAAEPIENVVEAPTHPAAAGTVDE